MYMKYFPNKLELTRYLKFLMKRIVFLLRESKRSICMAHQVYRTLLTFAI